jgi:hypothetical protein
MLKLCVTKILVVCWMCSDAKCPVSSATNEDRRNRADIAASFQRVAVLHLEEKCERAIDWALELEPSIKHMVRFRTRKRNLCFA